jgi:[ribosomal protein S18]-alanine N-acetyltransferase
MTDSATLAIPYTIAPMTVADLDAVMAIESVVYTTPWPASAYRHELEQNNMAHYLVLLPEGPMEVAHTSVRDRVRSWLGQPPRGRAILGYGGFWLMVGEAHISTVAVDPQWQGRGLGELLLLELIEMALRLQAEMVTLEVRVSNTVAQKLYEKYGFEYVGKRKRYYRDNNEDAHIMTVEQVQSPHYRAFLDEQWRRLRERLATPSNGKVRNAEARPERSERIGMRNGRQGRNGGSD